MSIEDPRRVPAEQPPQQPSAPPPESLEPVTVPPSPEDQARAAETLAQMQEAATEAPATDADPEAAVPAANTPLSREDIVQILQERQHAAGHSRSYPKATIGILGATGAFLAFFAALFASAFEKLGAAMGIKSEGGGKSAAKPAGGGGHH